MLIKFLSGKKRASRAAAYLLGALDSAGLPRPGVEVLRGDPRLVARVADGLPFRHKYTSAVISWAPEDKPGDAEISRTLDEFERLAWAGLEPSRRCWSAVLHREAGEGCHVHVLSARVDLGTGKSLNIAPPGWRRDFDPLRDWLNAAHGWARPDDPARARDLQPGFRACEAARRRRLGLEPPAPGLRSAVHGYLAEQVAHGDIADRAGIVAALETLGLQVPRQGRSYITVLEPQSDATERLDRASAALSQTSSRMLRSFWLPALATGLSLSIGICGGAWGLTHYLSRLILEKAELIEEQRLSLERLERGAAGLILRRDPEGGFFLAGPPGTSLTPARMPDGRPAWIIGSN